jgi:hypothetical protein
MVVPPSAHRLEGGDQFFNGGDSQNRGFGAGLGGEIRAGDGDVGNQVREDFNLAMADVSWQSSEPGKLQGTTKEGMTRIGDSDVAFAFLRDQRGITLGGLFPFRDFPPGSS